MHLIWSDCLSIVGSSWASRRFSFCSVVFIAAPISCLLAPCPYIQFWVARLRPSQFAPTASQFAYLNSIRCLLSSALNWVVLFASPFTALPLACIRDAPRILAFNRASLALLFTSRRSLSHCSSKKGDLLSHRLHEVIRPSKGRDLWWCRSVRRRLARSFVLMPLPATMRACAPAASCVLHCVVDSSPPRRGNLAATSRSPVTRG